MISKFRILNWSLKKMRDLFFIITLFFFLSCEESRNTDSFKDYQDSIIISNSDSILGHNSIGSVDSLHQKLRKVLLYGDTNIYNELSVAYFMAGDLQSFYYYSLIMVNKYEYGNAYFDLYLALSEPFTGQGFDDLDYKTQRLAIYYLLKSNELGNPHALGIIQDFFGKAKIPKSWEYQDSK